MAAEGAIWLGPLAILVAAYLLGSIPFGLLLTRLGGAGDLRALGSGNIGATNVLRTGRKGLAAATLLLDGAKGAAAVLLAEAALAGDGGLAAAGAFYGHIFPVWLRFRGGKGVATYLGAALALHWPSGVAYLALWLALSAATRRSSAGGVGGAFGPPVAAALLGRWSLVLLFLAFALTIVWTHRANLARLIAGDEPAIGRG